MKPDLRRIHGTVYGSLQYGKQVGNYSYYFATDAERDDNYRPFGAQNLQRVYADLGYRTPNSEFHAIGSFGRSLLGVGGVTPNVLINQDYTAVFTTPQTTNNQAGLAQITGRFDLWPKWSLASNFLFPPVRSIPRRRQRRQHPGLRRYNEP